MTFGTVPSPRQLCLRLGPFDACHTQAGEEENDTKSTVTLGFN